MSLCSCALSSHNDTLVMGVRDTADTLNPYLADSVTEKIIYTNCFEGLMLMDSEGNPDLAGATTYSVSGDGLTYTFRLNPDARWHITKAHTEKAEKSGLKKIPTQIDAEDYVFGIGLFLLENPEELSCIKGASEFRKSLSYKDLGVKATDTLTLTITLNKKKDDFLFSLATLPLFPCNEEFYNAFGKGYGKNPESTLMNGPYTVTELTETDNVILRRNPDYKGKTQVINKNITLHFTGTEDKLQERLLNGDYHLYFAENKENPAEPVLKLREDVTGIYSYKDTIYFHNGEISQ